MADKNFLCCITNCNRWSRLSHALRVSFSAGMFLLMCNCLPKVSLCAHRSHSYHFCPLPPQSPIKSNFTPRAYVRVILFCSQKCLRVGVLFGLHILTYFFITSCFCLEISLATQEEYPLQFVLPDLLWIQNRWLFGKKPEALISLQTNLTLQLFLVKTAEASLWVSDKEAGKGKIFPMLMLLVCFGLFCFVF